VYICSKEGCFLKICLFFVLLQIDVPWIVYFLEIMDNIGVVVTERLTAVLSYTVLHGRSTSEQQAMIDGCCNKTTRCVPTDSNRNEI